jgi:uncharacterized protein (TIGR03437 family)
MFTPLVLWLMLAQHPVSSELADQTAARAAAVTPPPRIQSDGVVNAASYAQPISPGSLVTIFGTDLASKQTTAGGVPLPTELDGTSVTVNGTNAPLLFVSSTQINLQAPSSLPWGPGNPTGPSASPFGTVSIVVTTPFGSSEPVQVPVYDGSPATFSHDGSGCGEAAALNIAGAGTFSINSPSNSAAPGDYVALFGTGLTFFSSPVADGAYATGPVPASFEPGLWLDGVLLQYTAYAGLAPMLVGVTQVNFQIPQSTREGCAVPVAVDNDGLIGPAVTISIHSGRGRCVDPPVQSYGQVTLTETRYSGTNHDGTTDTLTAAFPSAPGLKRPQPAVESLYNVIADIPVTRSCSGYPRLSAGVVSIRGSGSGQTVAVRPSPVPEGVDYTQALPSGFIGPGLYAIEASGDPVAFYGTLRVGSPIQIQSALAPGTQINSSEPFVIRWTGGDPGTLVKVSLVSVGPVYSQYDYGYADAASGSFTFDPICDGNPVSNGGNGVSCSFGLPSSEDAEVIVEVAPAPGTETHVTARAITDSVQLSWLYRYVFSGLKL